MQKIGLLKDEIKEITESLLKELGTIPFKINNNKNIVNDIFNQYVSKFILEPFDLLYNKYKNYFKKIWNPYFQDGTFNYIYLNKKQRCNSYLENYNKRFKQFLSTFLSQKGRTIIPWPIFIIFIKNKKINIAN